MTETTAETRVDHVVLQPTVPGFSRFLCRNCGHSWSFEMPVSVSVLVGASTPYIELHRYCEKRAEVTP